MSARATSPIHNPSQALLRWFVESNALPREAVVSMIERRGPEAVLQCPFQIPEQTKVYLIGKNYTASGLVNRCWEHGASFMLVITVQDGDIIESLDTPFEPGALHLDEWMSEEAEEKILKDLDKEVSSRIRVRSGTFGRLRSLRFHTEEGLANSSAACGATIPVASTGLFQFFTKLGFLSGTHDYLFASRSVRTASVNPVWAWPLQWSHAPLLCRGF